MTTQDKPDAEQQGDALTPEAVAAMRELGYSAQQIEAERQAAERIRAAGGFSKYVRKAEAARLFSESTGLKLEPEHMDAKEHPSRAALLAQVAGDEAAASPPTWWAYLFSLELAERNGWDDVGLRAAAEATFMRTLEAKADTLPLLQAPSLEPWPHPLELPPRWREGLFMRKTDLRTWAKEHAPQWLCSALLAEPAPQSAPAGKAVTIAGPGTAAPEWQAKAREIAQAHWEKHKAMNLQGTLQSYAEHVAKELRSLKITGPRGEWLSANTVKRDALQGAQWWGKRTL